jgi:hypothetical protein
VVAVADRSQAERIEPRDVLARVELWPAETEARSLIIELARQLEQVEAERDRLQSRIDGEGPQVSMGTAAGLLSREVEARKQAESERDRYREAIDQHLKWCSSPDVLSEALHPQEGAERG